MNRFSPDSNIFSGSPCLQELQKNPLLVLAEVSNSQPSGFGYPVQILKQSHSGYLKQQLTNQDTPGSSRTLSVFSAFHLPPSVHSSITFSQPSSRSIAAVSPLTRHTQQQALSETVEFKATESSGSGELLPPTPDLSLTLKTLKEVRESDRRRANRARYAASDKGKEAIARTNAKYQASKKGKEARARYIASDKDKKAMARAKYLASNKGRETRTRYAASDKSREASARRWAKFAASDKGKADQAVRYARTTAYRLAIKQGLSQELAREKGELAAKAKKAELSSVPAFQSPD